MNQRALLLVIQIALAVLVIDLARRVRRAAASSARAELESPPRSPEPSEPEPEPSEPDGSPESERPSAEAAPKPPAVLPRAGASRNLAALLVFAMVALFPAWDALLAASSVGALSDAMRGAPGTEAPMRALLFAAGGLGAALLVRQLMDSSPYAARGVFALAVLAVLAEAVPLTYEVALARSRQVDGWPVCETGLDVEGNLPNIETIYRGAYDGPRLPTGEPCTLAAERRDQHGATSPRGEFSDGIVQIGARFPDDRRRVLWGSLAMVLIAGGAGVLIWRAAEAPAPPRSPEKRRDAEEPVSETNATDEDDEADSPGR